MSLKSGFNPRSRVGSDGPGQYITNPRAEFQSTLPRGERQSTIITFAGAIQVSIHAPAWGATIGSNPDSMSEPVSIHAPAWGATPVIAL